MMDQFLIFLIFKIFVGGINNQVVLYFNFKKKEFYVLH